MDREREASSRERSLSSVRSALRVPHQATGGPATPRSPVAVRSIGTSTSRTELGRAAGEQLDVRRIRSPAARRPPELQRHRQVEALGKFEQGRVSSSRPRRDLVGHRQTWSVLECADHRRGGSEPVGHGSPGRTRPGKDVGRVRAIRKPAGPGRGPPRRGWAGLTTWSALWGRTGNAVGLGERRDDNCHASYSGGRTGGRQHRVPVVHQRAELSRRNLLHAPIAERAQGIRRDPDRSDDDICVAETGELEVSR